MLEQEITESYLYHAGRSSSGLIILCDHATNIVPPWVCTENLGLGPEDLGRHIAYDVGALDVSRALAQNLDGTLLATQFSRLVIDPNRHLEDPTLIMKIYDKTLIPSNHSLDTITKQARIKRLYQPYHDKIQATISQIRQANLTPIIVSIHSFTKAFVGQSERPWHIGVLSNADKRLSIPLIEALNNIDPAYVGLSQIVIGDNQPYHGGLVGDTLDQHTRKDGLLHVLIEIRNDLISTQAQGVAWAKLIETALVQMLAKQESA